MKLDMSYTTCEPLPELQDRRERGGGSMPGSGASTRKGSSESHNSGTFFPQISRSKGCSSAESNYNDDGVASQDGRPHSDNESYNRNKNTSRSSHASSMDISRKANPEKLPQVDVKYHKSKSVTSLCSNKSRNALMRAEMCRSPSCPSLYSEYEDPGLVEQGDLNASIHHHHSRKNTGEAVKLPEIYDSGGSAETPRTGRSNNYNGIQKGSKIDKELQRFSMRRQREEEERKQRVRKAHRQQQLERQFSQPTALLLPIRKPNRAKKDRQRQSEGSSQSYNSAHSVQSDSGISTSLRQSDTSDASNRAEESEWSGWEEGEGYRETEEEEEEDDDDDDEYEDAEEDDAGYEEEDEYEETNDGETYYGDTGEEYYEEKPIQGDNQNSYQNNECSGPTQRDARHRRYKVAQSQDPQDYQAPSEMDSTEKCKEWLDVRRRNHKGHST